MWYVVGSNAGDGNSKLAVTHLGRWGPGEEKKPRVVVREKTWWYVHRRVTQAMRPIDAITY
jgi:hypothetical protein